MATAVTNVNKSGIASTQQELNIGSGFNLLVATGYKLVIQAVTSGTVVTGVDKNSSVVTNVNKS